MALNLFLGERYQLAGVIELINYSAFWHPLFFFFHYLLSTPSLQDLRVVKTLVAQCFPPHYKPFATYLALYQRALAAHIQELASDEQQPNEMISLLAWVLHMYPRCVDVMLYLMHGSGD